MKKSYMIWYRKEEFDLVIQKTIKSPEEQKKFETNHCSECGEGVFNLSVFVRVSLNDNLLHIHQNCFDNRRSTI
jgi:formylmethanofuran dehydrogenase subunit E